VTNVTNKTQTGHRICGTIVENIMQVFTAIFLAETQGSDTGKPEESTRDFTGLFEKKPALFQIKPINLERISMLESRNWFLDDLSSEED